MTKAIFIEEAKEGIIKEWLDSKGFNILFGDTKYSMTGPIGTSIFSFENCYETLQDYCSQDFIDAFEKWLKHDYKDHLMS